MALTDNLVAYWKLDESSGDASDSVGSFTLTNNGTVTYSSGKINNGADFGSSNSSKYFVGGSATNILGASCSAFTISLWYKHVTGASGMLVGWRPNSDAANAIYIYPNDDTHFEARFRNSGGTAYTLSAAVAYTGNYDHIVMSYDGSYIDIYFNGVPVSGSHFAATGAMTSSPSNAFYLCSNLANAYCSGSVDEVGIWTRALTAGEVSQLWNGGNGSQYSFTDVKIALDSTTAANGTSGSSLTFSHTCSGANRILFVSATSNGGVTVTGVTYNGVSMTEINHHTDGAGPTTYLFYLIAPATGTNNVVISASGSSSLTGSAISYTGVKQSAQPDASGVGSDSTTTHYTQALSSVANNCWHILTMRTGNGYAWTADSGTAIRIQPETSYLGSCGVVDSNSPKTPAGSVTLGVTSTSQLFGGGIMASFAPYVAPTANSGAFFNFF